MQKLPHSFRFASFVGSPIRLFHVIAWLALALPLSAQEEAPRYAKFPVAGTDLLFSLFQTTYSFEVEAEEPYPIVLQVTRQGIPLWSQMAHVDTHWPFLNIECKVAWSPDFKQCAASYRTDRASFVVIALDFTQPHVKQQTFPTEELVDAILEKTGDTKGNAFTKAWTDSLEIANDGVVKLNLIVARAQPHRVTALFESKTGQLKTWAPAK